MKAVVRRAEKLHSQAEVEVVCTVFDEPKPTTGHFSMHVSMEEAKDYFVGAQFNIAISPCPNPAK